MRTLTVNTAGITITCNRYSYDSGATWTYGDFNPGTSNGFFARRPGDLTAAAE
jgi:hypothetical protein